MDQGAFVDRVRPADPTRRRRQALRLQQVARGRTQRRVAAQRIRIASTVGQLCVSRRGQAGELAVTCRACGSGRYHIHGDVMIRRACDAQMRTAPRESAR